MTEKQKPIDIVYTWVDDQLNGYRDLLLKYAITAHDINPNRTRDNLDLLKFSLRSVEKCVPWAGNIYIVTCRPQIPSWLDTSRKNITVIHHDEIMDESILPTFNSFCIVSFLHKIKNLSDYFIYVEDDRLFGNHIEKKDFISEDNKLMVYTGLTKSTPAEKRDYDDQGPWDMALAQSNHLLNMSFGESSRNTLHMPFIIEKQSWEDMLEEWKDAIETTRSSRFRAKYNVAPEYLYQYFMLNRNRARRVSFSLFDRKVFYLGLDNNLPLTLAGLSLLRLLKPKMYCLNDNFGESPDDRVVRTVREFLERQYPDKSSFEH